MNIEHLPDKILCRILRNLDFYDRRSSMLVSKRWNTEAFKACDRTVLKVFTSKEAIQFYGHTSNLRCSFNDMLQALLASQRTYKSIVLVWDTDTAQADTESDTIRAILNILRHSCYTAESLKMHSCGKFTDLDWLTLVLELFPNIRHLDIDNVRVENGSPNGISKFIEINSTNHIHTLLDKRQVGAYVRNATNVFANLSTVSMQVTSNITNDHLLHNIRRSLVHLMLDVSPTMFENYYTVQFPLLETFELYHEADNPNTSTSHLSQFLANAPNLKNLKLLTSVALPILPLLYTFYKTLKQLVINVQTLELDVLQKVKRFTNLERLWLRGITIVDFNPSVVFPALPNVQSLILESDGALDIRDDFYRACFPNLLVLHRHYMSIDKNLNLPMIVDQLPPSLRLLIIHNLFYQPDLSQLLLLCREVRVQELRMYCKQISKGRRQSVDPIRLPLHLQKLTINAKRIEPGLYESLLTALPGLRSLQLGLGETCDNQTAINLHQLFPRCHVTRVPKSHFESEMW